MKTLKLIFASLFRNDAAMEGRYHKWHIAVILFLLSVILATVPIFATAVGVDGSDFMNGTLYSFDAGIQRFSEELATKDVDLVIAETGGYYTLENTGDDWATAFPDAEGAANFHYYSYKDHTDQVRLKVYYQGVATNVEAEDFVNGKLGLENSADAINLDIVSFVFLAYEAAYVFIYNPAEVAAGTAGGQNYVSNMAGIYSKIPVGTNLKDMSLKDEFGNAIATPTNGTEYADYQEKILNNWKNFFDDAYGGVKFTRLWQTTGLMLAINTVLGFFMSLLIFVMTRGKNNPNRTMTFGESLKIGSWVLLSPAIIAMIVGLLFPNFAQMAFVLLVGLRMMWLSSKTLRPPLAPVAPKK